MAQARAHLEGRGFVTPDDVLVVAEPVLQVRLSGDYQSSKQLVSDVLDTVPVPD
jgi:MoxR-like ATPase